MVLDSSLEITKVKKIPSKITKITASIILASMLMYSVPVAALTKDETVYSNLLKVLVIL